MRFKKVLRVLVLLSTVFGLFVACTFVTEHRDEMPAKEILGYVLMPGARETTERTCTEDLPCRWAVASRTAVVMMFDDQMDACRAAETLPDTRRQGWLAVRFLPGALTDEQKDNLMYNLDNYLHSADAMDNYPWIIHPCP